MYLKEKRKVKEEQHLQAQREDRVLLRFALAVDTPTSSVKASSESQSLVHLSHLTHRHWGNSNLRVIRLLINKILKIWMQMESGETHFEYASFYWLWV